VERGQAPSRNPHSSLQRWSTAERVALDDMSFFTDHQVGDTAVPWTARQQSSYLAQVAARRPSASDGGGNETAATHGPIYYGALAPAYMLASSSPFAQLALMRLTSALIGALTVVFTFLLARELFPRRPWIAVAAGLLVAYQPMYGFISGAVNNDVGVNAGAAALELLLIVILRRGLSLGLGLLAGGLLAALPLIKGTAYSLYPVAGIALLATLWRHHRRRDLAGLAAFAVGALGVSELSAHVAGVFRGSSASSGPAEAGSVVAGATSEALAHPLGYLSYLWEVFLPRLSFMAPHFAIDFPGFVIFVERGWGAFGWFDVFFPHWVYVTILVAMLAVAVLGVVAVRREWVLMRANALELGILLLMPIAVVAGFEAAFYTAGARLAVVEFGRYAFPAIAPVAVLVVGSLHAFGRRSMIFAGAGLLVAMIALSYASQLLTLTSFYA
jgi:4-amino-4-deoxy-L-arabinose transferase-like glycosyltransferase